MVGAKMIVATVPVIDLERAKAFYGETLGLTLLWENPASARFRCGEVTELSIFNRPGTATEHTLAHFEVTDIEATVKDLESRGVQFIDYDEGPLTTTNHISQLGPARGASGEGPRPASARVVRHPAPRPRHAESQTLRSRPVGSGR